MDEKLISFLIQAHKVLAALDEKVKNIPSMDYFVSIYVRKEALLLSQYTAIEDALNGGDV